MHVAQANAELFTKMQQDHTWALTNPATATQADRTSVALLTKTISELSSIVALLTAKLVTAQAENARIKKSGQQSTKDGHGYLVSSNTTQSEKKQRKIATYILEADSGSTHMGTNPPMDIGWRSPTLQLPAVSQTSIITSQLRD